MNHRHLLNASLFIVLLGAAFAARADPCPGASPFSDVNAADGFCTNTEWLANRSITQGCGPGLYCPAQAVSRAQLALFMNRLATALAPTTVYVSGDTEPGTFSPAVVRCQTASMVVSGYPRVAQMQSMTNFDAPTLAIDLSAVPVYSLNSGATWVEFGQHAYATLYPGSTPPQNVTTSQFSRTVNLTPGSIVRFGVRIARSAGAGTVNSACSLSVRIENRNGLGSPYDELDATSSEAAPGH